MNTSPDMATVLHAGLYGRFIEIPNHLRGKNLHRTNQDSNFLVGSFSNRDNVRAQSNSEEKDNHRILIDDFSSRTDPSISKSIASVLLDWANQTS